MADLIVLTFAGPNDAAAALAALRRIAVEGRLHLLDTAIVTRDGAGTVHVKNEVSSATEIGAVAGALLGAVLMFMVPLAGIVVGAAGGALVGRLLDQGVDDRFVQEVGAALRPGTSALFLLTDRGDPEAVVAALQPFTGSVYQTTLVPDLEAEMRHALE